MLETVVPGVYAWVQPDGTWWVNNAGAVVGGDDVFIVDTCATEARTRRFLAAVDGVAAGRPVRMAVNTHQHGDHTYGNCLLPAATVLFGHEHMREALRTDPIIDGCPPFWTPVPDWGDVTRRLPDVAVRDAVTVHAGGRRIELRHPGGTAHTPGDLVAWLPEERVLFAGDLVFSGLTPLVLMGSVGGAARALDWMAALEPEHVVPGHGPVLHGPQIGAAFAKLRRYYTAVTEAADPGLTPLEAARAFDLGEFADWADAERIVLNLHRAYAERAGAEPDLIAALRDAVAWRGGPMPTSV
ncbi:MBL fold metallo-hydrolase [Dactylosporangium vinaceum]|uniref:MBL fold metallo-hydrolase n=1 Tax=Dactylosporangium vinaceum TaxID=53362 RepID=A0ABV5MN56_9ACTN|nr:MBL fold metallo-hydrolase [Dactylosporangium vinaceum]UAB92309.1 MBL fold metallo-hydrolase [Dactylosporangium vinaceum]